MGIVQTFERCLDSPYLFRDGAAPGRVAGLLAFAEDRLAAAGAIAAGAAADPDDITEFSYEAALACVRALVYARGYREAGLRCLLLACEELYVRDGRLDPAHLLAMARSQAYKDAPGIALAAARAFLQRAGEILGPDGRATAISPNP